MKQTRKATGFSFERNDGGGTIVVEFDDGLQVVFCPHTRAVPRPKLSYVLLRSLWTGEQLARYNIHESEGGGKFCLVDGADYAPELGERWEEASAFLNVDNMSASLRLGITDEQRDAWDYVNGSTVYARRLKGKGL